MPTARPRLSDPLIASVIFAPTARNYTFSSVTASADMSGALALEWMMEQEESVIEQILKSRRCDGREIEQFIQACYQQFGGPIGQGYGAAITTSMSAPARVPARSFPFLGHFDLLARPPVEGMSFDVDDFVEY